MASPTPKRAPNTRTGSPVSRYPPRPAAGPPEVVDPRWLLKALLLTVAGAAILGYLSVCLLLYQGGWQLFLHPSRLFDRTPASVAIPFENISFDSALTGRPRLHGWWIPAAGKHPVPGTILFLHNGEGSLASKVDQLELIHRADANIFAIDYRGYGQSDPTHPTEARMAEDSAAALDYLVNTRHIPPSHIVPYGVGLATALAASLVQAHTELPALIIDNPDPDAALRLRQQKRMRFLPVFLLMRDRFDLNPLRSITKPKLLIIGGPGDSSPQRDASNTIFLEALPSPKITVTLPAGSNMTYTESISRFLDQAVPSS